MIEEITKRLDLLQQRFDTFERLRSRGSMIDERILEDMGTNYSRGLEHLRSLKAYEELRAYTAWYKRYLGVDRGTE